MSNSPSQTIWLGYDSREAMAYAIAKYSIERYNRYIPIYGLVIDDLREQGLYYRPMEMRKRTIRQVWEDEEVMWDVISDAPMSTEFSNSRFLVPHLAKTGWALFSDSDVIFRRNPSKLFELADPSKAIMVVKHDYEQKEGTKMDGQIQTIYPRKNWSSVILFNCDHPANKALTVSYINEQKGRDLHRFSWIEEEALIGELPREWNYCVGHSPPLDNPAIVHFTDGIPDMIGYEHQEFADEWKALRRYAVGASFGRAWK